MSGSAAQTCVEGLPRSSSETSLPHPGQGLKIKGLQSALERMECVWVRGSKVRRMGLNPRYLQHATYLDRGHSCPVSRFPAPGFRGPESGQSDLAKSDEGSNVPTDEAEHLPIPPGESTLLIRRLHNGIYHPLGILGHAAHQVSRTH